MVSAGTSLARLASKQTYLSTTGARTTISSGFLNHVSMDNYFETWRKENPEKWAALHSRIMETMSKFERGEMLWPPVFTPPKSVEAKEGELF